MEERKSEPVLVEPYIRVFRASCLSCINGIGRVGSAYPKAVMSIGKPPNRIFRFPLHTTHFQINRVPCFPALFGLRRNLGK